MTRNVYLVQVNWTNCAGNPPGYWVPYSVGSLWAYAETVAGVSDSYDLRGLIFERQPIAATVEGLDAPDVVGFSNYVWNEQYNLAFARRVKERWPGALVVFGGPQVPDRSDGFFERHPFIDVAVHSEGEHAFATILLERLRERPDYTTIAGCSINRDGQTLKTPPGVRLRDLSRLPSPYLTGVFDEILDRHPDGDWNAVIENNRGCPYRCAFCDWGTLTYTKIARFPQERVLADVRWLAQRRVAYVMPADANFGIFAEDDMRIADEFVACRRRHGYPLVVGMAFAKNSNERVLEIAGRLHEAGLLKALTLSTQSMTPAVLQAIRRRNMASSNLGALLHECNRRQIPTYTELILGLPMETLESWRAGLCEALELGQHNQLESWLLEMLENAPLNDPATIEEHGLKAVRLKNYTFLFDRQEDDEAPEEIPIVYETRTMPYADFQQALGFSMLIYNFHAYGWTQFLARFLRREHGVPYLDFYRRLEAWVKARDDTILHREYAQTVRAFRQMVETGNYVVDRWLLRRNVGSVPIGLRSQGFLQLEPDETHDAIALFASETFGALLGDELDEVLRFQRHLVTAPHRRYPYRERFSRDFAQLLREGPMDHVEVEYTFDTILPFSGLEEYLALVYSKKKQGFGKATISRVAAQRPALAG